MHDLSARLAKWAEVFDAVSVRRSRPGSGLLRRANAAFAENRRNAALVRELLLCAAARNIDHAEAVATMRKAAGAVRGSERYPRKHKAARNQPEVTIAW
jgi:hypothetical protein